MTPALVEIAGLSAGYGEVPVLSGVDLVIRPGEIVTLVGSNGAGKTTLLRAISRVIGARGTLRFDGRDLTALAPEQVFGLGLVQVPEGRQLFDRMSVEDNLRMGTYRRRDEDGIRRSFERVYQLFPVLAERRQQIAGSLSGGEQQMCAIARALMAAPKLLTVDEMSLGLAPVVVDQLLGRRARRDPQAGHHRPPGRAGRLRRLQRGGPRLRDGDGPHRPGRRRRGVGERPGGAQGVPRGAVSLRARARILGAFAP